MALEKYFKEEAQSIGTKRKNEETQNLKTKKQKVSSNNSVVTVSSVQKSTVKGTKSTSTKGVSAGETAANKATFAWENLSNDYNKLKLHYSETNNTCVQQVQPRTTRRSS